MDRKIFIMDKETGEATELTPTSVSVSFDTKDKVPADIKTSYQFVCKMDIRNFYSSIKDMYSQSWEWKRANKLADDLNDLIEEYNAPGTPRKERRTLIKKFKKTLQLLDKHCRKYKLTYSFINQ